MTPYLCQYYLVDWCNAKCDFCGIWKNKPHKVSSLSRVRWDLEDLKRLSVKYIDFTGGEPLLRKEAPAVFEMAEELHLRYGFVSNGTFADRWKEFAHLSPYSVFFSLDSPRKDEHDNHRHYPLFDKVISSINISKNLGWNPTLMFSPTRETFGRLEEMLDLANQFDVLVNINPVWGAPEKRLTDEQFSQLRSLNKDHRAFVDTRCIDMFLSGGNHIKNRTCRSMDTVITVAPDSSVYVPCYHHNVVQRDGGIYGIVKSDWWKEQSERAGRYPFCQNCNIACYLGNGLTFKRPLETLKLMLMYRIKSTRSRSMT